MVYLFNFCIVLCTTFTVTLSSSISDLNNNWNYESSNDWYKLPGSDACKITSSSLQSPIDFNNINVDNELEYPSYKVLNNGCSNWEKYSNDNGFGIDFNNCNNLSILYKNNEYIFNKFLFHSPSEHSINGEYSSGEVQLLHSNPNNGANLIVSILIKESLDSRNNNNLFLNSVWTDNNIKTSIPLNPYSSFISNDQSHYDYMGSLTSPPCTEGINWIVLSEPLEISSIDFYNLQTKLTKSIEKGQITPISQREVHTNRNSINLNGHIINLSLPRKLIRTLVSNDDNNNGSDDDNFNEKNIATSALIISCISLAMVIGLTLGIFIHIYHQRNGDHFNHPQGKKKRISKNSVDNPKRERYVENIEMRRTSIHDFSYNPNLLHGQTQNGHDDASQNPMGNANLDK